MRKNRNRKKGLQKIGQKYDAAFTKILELTPKDDTKGHDIISKVKTAQEEASVLNSKVLDLILATKNDEAVDFMNKEVRPAVRQWINAVDALGKYQQERSQMRYEEAKKGLR